VPNNFEKNPTGLTAAARESQKKGAACAARHLACSATAVLILKTTNGLPADEASAWALHLGPAKTAYGLSHGAAIVTR
jgi:hypothetical protein